MIKCENHIELMRKFQETSKNCGVKLRTKTESSQHISERLMQLRLEGKSETKEYRFLAAILERNR
jgi:hypothetical protein